MRLLTYFARYYAGVFAVIEAGLVIVVLAANFVNNAGYLARNENGGGAALGLAVYGAAEFGHQVFPVACLLSAVVAGTLLARSGELLAVQAAGVSSLRVGVAFTVVVALAVLAGTAAGDRLVPWAMVRLDRLQSGEPTPAAQSFGRYYDRHTQWFRQGNVLLFLPSYDHARRAFNNVVVYRLEGGLVTSVIDAESLVFQGRRCWLLNARELSVRDAEVVVHARLPLELSVKPQDLIDVTGEPTFMPSSELVAFAGRRERAGFDAAPFRLELHNRLAFPLSAFCMFLLVIPWALNPDRRRSVAVNLGAGVVVAGLLLTLTQVFRLLALSHRLPAPWGAWGIDAFCLASLPVSLALYHRHRTRGGLW